jgi:dipeptidyl aminopeptidase/acylaminoacyl peptidase
MSLRALGAACAIVLGAACSDSTARSRDDAGADVTDAAVSSSACVIGAESARCESKTVETLQGRAVYWNEPDGKAPSGGWPAVILYQGSLYGPSRSWNVELPKSTPYGGYYQVALIASLLAHGFVVVQPEALNGQVWQTNSGGDYAASSDASFIPALLDAMAQGTFGAVDTERLYATGISSGGYMTSRMAVSYPGKFRALAIESASYATCLGPLCTVPGSLPKDHPPTLLLHGTKDNIVPIATARAYYGALMRDGIETHFIEDANAGHQWLDVAPHEITSWFLAH